ncbi:MAG TPA: TIGR03435 family protein [Bryobacteraceae bacterium]|nr:TIGR03435 family protein [Bryobacteraceae bacterium]
MNRNCCASVAVLLLTAAGQAQTISYVAAVKENKSADARGFSEYYPGGRFSATAITVQTLLRAAYRIQNYQLAGAPGWFSTRRYDIVAKAEGNPPPQQQFLQALLKNQFKLAVHNETRELPAFALMMAKTDGKAGPQLRESDFDCGSYLASAHPLPEPDKVSPCSGRINMGSLSAKAIPIAQLATSLAAFVGRFVADRTGLTGRFDVALTWTPDEAAADGAGPSIFTAIQEQLGLKLVSEKAPVEVLVVDHVEEPASN